jgi:hypothetical protein
MEVATIYDILETVITAEGSERRRVRIKRNGVFNQKQSEMLKLLHVRGP